MLGGTAASVSSSNDCRERKLSMYQSAGARLRELAYAAARARPCTYYNNTILTLANLACTYVKSENAEHVLSIVSPGANVPGGKVLDLRQQLVQL